MRFARLALLYVIVLSAGAAAGRRHVENISSARHEYSMRLSGTVDGASTRDPIVYAAWKQGFEPMRSVRLENTGDTDVVNPWLLVNGKRNWRTTEDIAGEALRTYGDPARMSDAGKARAIFEFLRRNRFHATTGDFEVRDPVKMFNVYGFSLCGDNAPVLMDLWRAAGLRARRGFPIGHCVSEVWYDGGWHMLDGDESILFLDRDNRTVAAERAVAGDHDLSRRAYENEYLPALYNYDGSRSGDYPSHAGHRMEFTLRPGEALEWRWGQGEKLHYAPNPVLFLLKSADLHNWGPNAWATLRNGKWIYTPRLGKGAPPMWKMRTPYVIVGGRVRAAAAGACIISASYDGRNWREVARGSGNVEASLDALFPSPGEARYEYFVRAEGGGEVRSITIENDLQMAPLAMPALELGENRISYTDATAGPRSVRATFEWTEDAALQPPAAPAAPVFPADGAEVEGTAIAFEWQPAGAAYHFQLGDEPAIRWALSPAFDQVIAGKQRFALRSAGLLNPGQTYYWRVRAKSAEGVWGQWSKTWSFVPRAPGAPLDVRMEERAPSELALVWRANPNGRKPARYRVYASDEKGFTVADEPFEAAVGNQKTRGLFPGKAKVHFPANFLAETAEDSYTVKPRHAYYRVMAVDERGNRSGASEFVEAPRPWIYTEPPKEARVGVSYRYEPATVRGIGDLSYRDFGPGESYQAAFWDADAPRFSLETEMPRCGNFDVKWLAIDPQTGVVRGMPELKDVGEYQVNIRVEIPGRVHVQSYGLRVRP